MFAHLKSGGGRFNFNFLGRNYTDEFGHFHRAIKTSAFAVGEFDFAVRERKQRIICASADIFTRMNSGTALFDDNHSRFDNLAIVNFYAQTLGFGIASEPCRTAGFLM